MGRCTHTPVCAVICGWLHVNSALYFFRADLGHRYVFRSRFLCKTFKHMSKPREHANGLTLLAPVTALQPFGVHVAALQSLTLVCVFSARESATQSRVARPVSPLALATMADEHAATAQPDAAAAPAAAGSKSPAKKSAAKRASKARGDAKPKATKAPGVKKTTETKKKAPAKEKKAPKAAAEKKAASAKKKAPAKKAEEVGCCAARRSAGSASHASLRSLRNNGTPQNG